MSDWTGLSHGHGPRKIIVMSGWMGVARHWQPMLDALDEDRFEVVVFEYRGYGSRKAEDGAYNFDEAAADVITLADVLEWPHFSLIGHSMGGMAIQHVALAARERVQKLMGIAPVSAAGADMDATRRAFFESAVNDVSVRHQIFQLSTGQRLTQTWSRRMASDSRENLPQAMRGYLAEWSGRGFADRVTGLSVPVQVLVGEHDPGINAAQAARTWGLHYPHARIDVIPQVGHYPMQELPVSVAACAEAWLWQ